MARGKKLGVEVVYSVMASYAVTGNARETARLLDLPPATVSRIIKDNKGNDEFRQLETQKKDEFVSRSGQVIDLLLDAVYRKAVSYQDDEVLALAKLTEITTALGTLFDKRALALGDSTENVTFKLPDGVKRYAK